MTCVVRQEATDTCGVKYVPDWLPGAGFKRRAAEVKRMVREAAQKTFELAASNVVSRDLSLVALVAPENPTGW